MLFHLWKSLADLFVIADILRKGLWSMSEVEQSETADSTKRSNLELKEEEESKSNKKVKTEEGTNEIKAQTEPVGITLQNFYSNIKVL